jgi:hypothetical protein
MSSILDGTLDFGIEAALGVKLPYHGGNKVRHESIVRLCLWLGTETEALRAGVS